MTTTDNGSLARSFDSSARPIELQETSDNETIALKLAQELDSKKGDNILLLDVQTISNLFDYLLLVSGRSTVHLQAMQDDCEQLFSKYGFSRRNPRDRNSSSPWILIDFGFLIVHLLHEEARNYYGLERIWQNNNVLFESGKSVFGTIER